MAKKGKKKKYNSIQLTPESQSKSENPLKSVQTEPLPTKFVHFYACPNVRYKKNANDRSHIKRTQSHKDTDQSEHN